METDLIQDQYVHLTNWTQGLCQNTILTTDEIVINSDGVYKINWGISSQCGTANQVIEFDLFVNETEQPDGSARRSFGTANTIGNTGASAILNLKKGDNVDIRAKNTTSSANILVYHGNFNVVQLTGV